MIGSGKDFGRKGAFHGDNTIPTKYTKIVGEK